MSASESSPLTSRVHQSLEQLIAETVRQSTELHEREGENLKAAMRSALAEIETSRLAMDRAAETLRAALGDEPASAPVSPAIEPETEVSAPVEHTLVESTTPTVQDDVQQPAEPSPESAQTVAQSENRGPHELDIIAHGATITRAAGLQSLLRAADEVSSVQTRQFVNGELRLHAEMTRTIDLEALTTWLNENGGRVATTTDRVIEIHFAD